LRRWLGLDVDLCRGIADALLGSPAKVKFIGTTSKVRFSVLQSGEITCSSAIPS
jgi:general L-amino acid transport system substrate-binding protein